MKAYFSATMNRLRARFSRLYGEAGDRCLERLAMLVGRYGVGDEVPQPDIRWSEKDAVLITYPDVLRAPGEKALVTLERFLTQRLQGAVNTVHLLPFFPYSSDDGFSVTDYRVVRPDLGNWDNIQTIGRRFRLMTDLVLNHVSRQGAWFSDYVVGIAPARHYFIEMDPQADLSAVVRPRSKPLLTATQTRGGERHVWTTFSEDQIDLNFANPDVLFEFLDILFLYISQGARIIRLDAIAYLWKKPGTPCIHLPETHEVVKLLRDVTEMVAPDVLLLTETNVPQEENYSYFGDGDEAHVEYQFSLPPLLLHALQTGRTRYLTQWAAALPAAPPGCTFLNFTASHDGVGVRPLEGILPAEEFDALVKGIRDRGGYVSTRRNSDGSDSPYELNITYLDALTDPAQPDAQLDVARFLCSQTVALALKGIPAVYFHSLVATRNDLDAVQRTGRPRTINRKKWIPKALDSLLEDESSLNARVFNEYVRRLRVRAAQAAFHPDGKQSVLDLGEGVFALERTAPDESETITAVSNFSTRPIELRLDDRIPSLSGAGTYGDLIAGRTYNGTKRTLPLAPYQTVWLTPIAVET